MIGGALYVRVTLQGLARPCISLTSHLATFCTFADVKYASLWEILLGGYPYRSQRYCATLHKLHHPPFVFLPQTTPPS